MRFLRRSGPLPLVALAGLLGASGALGAFGCRRDMASALPGVPDADADGIDALAEPATWSRWRDADYLVLAHESYHGALAPLVAHRESLGHVVAVLSIEETFRRFSKGEPDAAALVTAIGKVHAHSGGKLRFVLLVGDVVSPSQKTAPGFVPLPTHYLPKLDYEHHGGDKHDHPLPFPFGEHAHEVAHTGELYPSDRPYSLVAGAGGASKDAAPARLAVGRIPARNVGDVAAFVKKLLDYETVDDQGAWRRRLTVFAGPANYGAAIDGIIESTANRLLDENVSYDFDVRFTFAKLGSPYAFRFDRFHQKLVSDLDEGALVAAYVGHGASWSFDDVHFHGGYFFIGTTEDAANLRIPKGKPLFFSFACDTGAFDRFDGRTSLAEEMILNADGPIGVFAASRESHPYPNALYGEAVIDQFVDARPRTVGEGILAMETQVKGASLLVAKLLVDTDEKALKEEHEGLYNLLGDPGTRLRYPDPATVGVKMPEKSGDPWTVTASAKVDVDKATITLETRRSVIRGALVDGAALEKMTNEAAFAAMDKNYAMASDKVLASKEVAVAGGTATATFDAPKEAGDVVVKVWMRGKKTAVGHAVMKKP